jgi:hypothetical protein
MRGLYSQQERKLAEELSTKFRGTTSVDIAVLNFPFQKLKDEGERNTERLEILFKKTQRLSGLGCFNYIPAVIQHDQLDAALDRSEISSEAPLEARDGHTQLYSRDGLLLSCLRGQHRALAAKSLGV